MDARDHLKRLLNWWWWHMDDRATKKERRKLAKKARAKTKAALKKHLKGM